jgi:hypothetical protein
MRRLAVVFGVVFSTISLSGMGGPHLKLLCDAQISGHAEETGELPTLNALGAQIENGNPVEIMVLGGPEGLEGLQVAVRQVIKVLCRGTPNCQTMVATASENLATYYWHDRDALQLSGGRPLVRIEYGSAGGKSVYLEEKGGDPGRFVLRLVSPPPGGSRWSVRLFRGF